jgi:ABC-2 type transport system ATP-binding protein
VYVGHANRGFGVGCRVRCSNAGGAGAAVDRAQLRRRTLLLLPFADAGHLEFFAALYGFDRRETARRVQAALERTGLWEERRTYYSDCSTGMKKRLNFARSLLRDAPVHICDEPTTGVDVDSGLRLRSILHELREAGRTVLLVSHNMEEVAALADRVGLMHHGRIVHEDTPDGFRRLIAPRELLLELIDPPSADLLADLRALPCVERVSHSQLDIRVAAADPERVMSDVIAVLHRRSVLVSAVQVVRPELADVFRHQVKD